MSERKQALKRALMDARQDLNAVLDRVGDRWEAPVYADGAAWSVRQLAIHLMITDRSHNLMMAAIARGENSVPEDFDLQRYNQRSVEKRAEATVEDIRAALAVSAAERLAWLDALDEPLLDRQGRHGTLRILSIEQILGVIAAHERAHARDIAVALGLV